MPVSSTPGPRESRHSRPYAWPTPGRLPALPAQTSTSRMVFFFFYTEGCPNSARAGGEERRARRAGAWAIAKPAAPKSECMCPATTASHHLVTNGQRRAAAAAAAVRLQRALDALRSVCAVPATCRLLFAAGSSDTRTCAGGARLHAGGQCGGGHALQHSGNQHRQHAALQARHAEPTG